MWADSKRSDRMVIDLINTVRHSDTESSNINLQILYGCHEEWCSRVWKTLHTGMSFALKVEHRFTHARDHKVKAVRAEVQCFIKMQWWYLKQSPTLPLS